MTLASIRQSIENIDYAWNKPQTYLVLVPVLSLVIQKVQMAKILPLPPIPNELHDSADLDRASRKFSSICKAHFIGSVIQTLALLVVTAVLNQPAFVFIGCISCYEMLDTVRAACNNLIIAYKFDHNGAGVSNIQMVNPLTYFK